MKYFKRYITIFLVIICFLSILAINCIQQPVSVKAETGTVDTRYVVNPEDIVKENKFWPDKTKPELEELFYYKSARVLGVSGYPNEWQRVYYANIKNDMSNSKEGGFPHYGHAEYLPYVDTGDGLQKFTFSVMRKIKNNVNIYVGTGADYYFNKNKDQGFPNYKNRKVTGSGENRVVHPEGSGHFINEYYDSSGKKRGEWRYLGYGNSFQTIGNPFFPADVPPSGRDAYLRNWQVNPWSKEKYPYFGVEKNTHYNDPLSKLGVECMLKFMKTYELDKIVTDGPAGDLKEALKKAKDKYPADTLEIAMAKVLTQYFAIGAVATDYSSGFITGVHISGGKTYYMTLKIPALAAPENVNLKVASPAKVTNSDGSQKNIGTFIDSKKIVRNCIEVYECDAQGKDKGLNLVKADVKDGEFNATLVAGKTYLFRAFVLYENEHPVAPRDTYKPIRVTRKIEFNGKNTPEFIIDNDGIDDSSVQDKQDDIDKKPFNGKLFNGIEFGNNPMKANKVQTYEWQHTIPLQQGGETVTTMKFHVELAGKVTNKVTNEVRSYPDDNLWSDNDDASTINLKIDNPLPNLTVASPKFPVPTDREPEKTNIEIYEKEPNTGVLTKITPFKDVPDSKGFNGYIKKLKKYVARVYVYNNPRSDGKATLTNITANFKLCYNNNPKLCNERLKVDGSLNDPLKSDEMEYMDYEFETAEKIDNNEVSYIVLEANIVNGQNCHPDDNKITTDDSAKIILSLDPPMFPNMKVASYNYTFEDKNNVFRNKIDVSLKGSTTLLDPAVDELIPGKTYTFTSHVKFDPGTKNGEGKMIDNFVKLDRTYRAKVGYDVNAPISQNSGLEAPNNDTVALQEDITIPTDFNTNFKYCTTISSAHTNRDNSFEVEANKLDDTSCVTYPIGKGPNLLIEKIKAFKLNTTTPLNPNTDKLSIGETYTFKIYMKYENYVEPQKPTEASGILCDYEISSHNPQFTPIGSINGSRSKLISLNFSNKKMYHENISEFTFNQKITQDMGEYIYIKGKVPPNYSLDNANPRDDEKISKFIIEYNDLAAESAYFTYNGSKTDTLTPDKMHSLVFRIRKVSGVKETPNVRVFYKVVDAHNSIISSGYLTGTKTLKNGDYEDYTVNNLMTNTGRLTAIVEIDPPDRVYHYPRGENNVRTNDIIGNITITSGFTDLSVASFKVNPGKIVVECHKPVPLQTISFNVQITNSNKTKSTLGDGITNVALVIRKKGGSILIDPSTNQQVIKYYVLPPDIQAGFSIVLNNYQLQWGDNEFTVEINPYRTIEELSTSNSNPYLNNVATTSIRVEQVPICNELEYPCELGLTTTSSNTWQETFYMMKRTGTKQSYDCSYTTQSGSYVSRTCYYCDPDNWEYWTEDWNYQEKFAVSAFYFRSQYTVDKYGGDGWVNILGNNSVGKVRAGSGFEVRIQTNYSTNRNNMPNTYYRDMCNYQTRNPGAYNLSNINWISVTIPEFKDTAGNPVTYKLYPLSSWGPWYNNTKEFQFPLRSAFGIEMNRKIYVNENAKIGSKINFKIVTDIFEPYFWDSDNKKLQACISGSQSAQSAQIEVADGTKVRTHVVD